MSLVSSIHKTPKADCAVLAQGEDSNKGTGETRSPFMGPPPTTRDEKRPRMAAEALTRGLERTGETGCFGKEYT